MWATMDKWEAFSDLTSLSAGGYHLSGLVFLDFKTTWLGLGKDHGLGLKKWFGYKLAWDAHGSRPESSAAGD